MEVLEDLENLDINEHCFKVHVNFKENNFDKVLDALSEISDVAYFNKSLYVWLKDGQDKKSLLFFIKGIGIEEFYCEPLYYNEIKGRNDFLESFVSKHFYSLQLNYINSKRQKELNVMYENIEKIKDLLKNNK